MEKEIRSEIVRRDPVGNQSHPVKVGHRPDKSAGSRLGQRKAARRVQAMDGLHQPSLAWARATGAAKRRQRVCRPLRSSPEDRFAGADAVEIAEGLWIKSTGGYQKTVVTPAGGRAKARPPRRKRRSADGLKLALAGRKATNTTVTSPTVQVTASSPHPQFSTGGCTRRRRRGAWRRQAAGVISPMDLRPWRR
jgi:hypothetical protein